MFESSELNNGGGKGRDLGHAEHLADAFRNQFDRHAGIENGRTDGFPFVWISHSIADKLMAHGLLWITLDLLGPYMIITPSGSSHDRTLVLPHPGNDACNCSTSFERPVFSLARPGEGSHPTTPKDIEQDQGCLSGSFTPSSSTPWI